jgi:hypothetical protein
MRRAFLRTFGQPPLNIRRNVQSGSAGKRLSVSARFTATLANSSPNIASLAAANPNQRPNRYERYAPKRKTAKTLTISLNIVESASM